MFSSPCKPDDDDDINPIGNNTSLQEGTDDTDQELTSFEKMEQLVLSKVNKKRSHFKKIKFECLPLRIQPYPDEKAVYSSYDVKKRVLTIYYSYPSTCESYGGDMQSLCITLGGYFIQAGFSGDDAPRTVFRNSKMIGKKIFAEQAIEEYKKNAWDPMFRLHDSCITHGSVTNWDVLEDLLEYTFTTELRVTPEEHPVMIGENYNSTTKNEILTSIMFETFNVPAFQCKKNSVLAGYCSGRGSGVVVDIGYDTSSVVCYHEGFWLKSSFQYEKFGGIDITNYVRKLLFEEDNRFKWLDNHFKILENNGWRDAKEQLSNKYSTNFPTTKFALKNDFIEVDNGIIGSFVDFLFNPGDNRRGIHDICYDSIMSVDQKLRPLMFQNLYFSGGSTFLPLLSSKFLDRIAKKYDNPNAKMKTVFQPERKYASWIGCSILSSLTTSQSYWITKDEYDDVGPEIFRRKSHGEVSDYCVDSNKCIVWDNRNHKKYFKRGSSRDNFVLFMMCCIWREESLIYCLPREIMYCILEFVDFLGSLAVEDVQFLDRRPKLQNGSLEDVFQKWKYKRK